MNKIMCPHIAEVNVIAAVSFKCRPVYLFKCICIIFFIWLSNGTVGAQTDSTLTIRKLFEQVKSFHPVALVADIQVSKADASLLKARGSFDPVINSTLDHKQFEDKSYFSLFDGGLKIPTKFGAQFKTGYEYNRGVFLNPENNNPTNGLIYAGVSLPLGQGLLTDESRASLKNAEIGRDVAVNYKKDLLNQLLYQAVVHYWEWFRSYHAREIYIAALRNATERYQAVISNTKSGDVPGIDSIEARIQLQLIEASLNQANLEYNNISLQFSTFLWNNEKVNSGLLQSDQPMKMEKNDDSPSEIFNLKFRPEYVEQHPYLTQLNLKLQQADIDRKLKQDRIKPILNLQFNPLAEPIGNQTITNLTINNFKWGFEFKMPLLLRKERGDLKLAEYKIQESQLEIENLKAKLYSLYSGNMEWQSLREQTAIYSETVANYERMLYAETRLFEVGESSLFLVNSREQAYINARIKFIELLAKSKKSYYAALYAAGLLPDAEINE